MSLFTRRGEYSFDEQWKRLGQQRRPALEAFAAERNIRLPPEFASARTAIRALAALEASMSAPQLRQFVALAFDALGLAGDEGVVHVFFLETEPTPVVADPLFEGRVQQDLNAGGVPAEVERGRLPSRCLLEITFIEEGRAGLGFTFLDPELQVVYENGVPVRRTVLVPYAVDALYDPRRRALFVHGGRSPHVTRVVQLVGRALQRGASVVSFAQPPQLSEPLLYAVVDSFGGVIPASELRMFDPGMRPMKYGTSTLADVRLSDTGRRIKTEGLAREVDARLAHSAVITGAPERELRTTLSERWVVRLHDPLSLEGYLSLFDRIRVWHGIGAWMQPIESLARSALERRNKAVSQTDINTHALGVHDDIVRAIGNLIPAGANTHQRDLLATLVANALVRLIARSPRHGAPVAIGQELTRFLTEHGHVAGITLDREARSAHVRRVWRLLEESRGDLLAFARAASR